MVNGNVPFFLQNKIPHTDPNLKHLRSKDDTPKMRGMAILENTFIPKKIAE